MSNWWIKMKKTMVLLVILLLATLLVYGCTRGQNSQYPTGYAAYGQQQYPQQQAYIGGGCAVDGPDMDELPVDVSEPIAVA